MLSRRIEGLVASQVLVGKVFYSAEAATENALLLLKVDRYVYDLNTLFMWISELIFRFCIREFLFGFSNCAQTLFSFFDHKTLLFPQLNHRHTVPKFETFVYSLLK